MMLAMPPTSIAATTRLLIALSEDDFKAGEKLVPLIYDELREIAGKILAGNPRATLQATELIHEAYIRLVDASLGKEGWDGKVHFQRMAARAMRYVLVDRARARFAQKRGGSGHSVTLDEELVGQIDDSDRAIQVSDGLEQLSKVDPQLSQLVELRFFGGLSMEEIADNLGISLRSAQRSWRLARAWWIREFGEGGKDE